MSHNPAIRHRCSIRQIRYNYVAYLLEDVNGMSVKVAKYSSPHLNSILGAYLMAAKAMNALFDVEFDLFGIVWMSAYGPNRTYFYTLLAPDTSTR
jgi:hypothetical protein